MNSNNLVDDVNIILWLNGKEKEYSFKVTVNSKSTISLKYLKELIIKKIISNKKLSSLFSHLSTDLKICHLYNQKEILIEETDIQYLKQDEIIFFFF